MTITRNNAPAPRELAIATSTKVFEPDAAGVEKRRRRRKIKKKIDRVCVGVGGCVGEGVSVCGVYSCS